MTRRQRVLTMATGLLGCLAHVITACTGVQPAEEGGRTRAHPLDFAVRHEALSSVVGEIDRVGRFVEAEGVEGRREEFLWLGVNPADGSASGTAVYVIDASRQASELCAQDARGPECYWATHSNCTVIDQSVVCNANFLGLLQAVALYTASLRSPDPPPYHIRERYNQLPTLTLRLEFLRAVELGLASGATSDRWAEQLAGVVEYTFLHEFGHIALEHAALPPHDDPSLSTEEFDYLDGRGIQIWQERRQLLSHESVADRFAFDYLHRIAEKQALLEDPWRSDRRLLSRFQSAFNFWYFSMDAFYLREAARMAGVLYSAGDPTERGDLAEEEVYRLLDRYARLACSPDRFNHLRRAVAIADAKRGLLMSVSEDRRDRADWLTFQCARLALTGSTIWDEGPPDF